MISLTTADNALKNMYLGVVANQIDAGNVCCDSS